MKAVSAFESYVVKWPFEKALKPIRSALAEMDLEVVGESDIRELSRTLLVESPLLMFEAVALDRAAAVFFPLHIVVSALGDKTLVSLANPTRLFDARLPAGAAEPVDRLVARVEMALESIALPMSTMEAGES